MTGAHGGASHRSGRRRHPNTPPDEPTRRVGNRRLVCGPDTAVAGRGCAGVPPPRRHRRPRSPGLARFWSQVLGWPVLSEREREIVMGPADDARVSICFMPSPDDKIVKNRVHLDLNPGPDASSGEREAEIGEGWHVGANTKSGVWELPLPDGYTAQVAARAVMAPDLTFTVEAPPEAIADMRAGRAARDVDQWLVLGADAGGAVTILGSHLTPLRLRPGADSRSPRDHVGEQRRRECGVPRGDVLRRRLRFLNLDGTLTRPRRRPGRRRRSAGRTSTARSMGWGLLCEAAAAARGGARADVAPIGHTRAVAEPVTLGRPVPVALLPGPQSCPLPHQPPHGDPVL